MAHFHNNALVGASGQGGYLINQSLRFNSADSAYLNRTFSSPTDGKRWTFSFWMKRASLGRMNVFGYNGSTNEGSIDFDANNQLYINPRVGTVGGAGTNYFLQTSQVFRDTSAWYHIVYALDTTQATASDRVKLYVNGTQVTSFATANYPTQNSTPILGSAVSHAIGRIGEPGYEYYFGGYLAEVNFIDGTALTPSSFGETDTITGAWIPKKYSGSYGTNGFYLKFESSGIGTDSSGNSNTWTANNFSTSGTGTDVMSDTPTNNWCTLNPLNRAANGTMSNGNLEVSDTNATAADVSTGTIGMKSGKYYFEFTRTSVDANSYYGIIRDDKFISGQAVGLSAGQFGYYVDGDGLLSVNGSTTNSWITAFSTNDVCMVAYDADTGKVWFGRNGTWGASGDPAAGTNPAATVDSFSTYGYVPWLRVIGGAGTERVVVNFGQRSFSYTPPTGFKALNTANLPEPTIKKGSKYFNTVLYTGNGSTQSISGVGFQPDFVWIKKRSATGNHMLTDAVRGANTEINSNTTAAEIVNTNALTSFNSDGFSVGIDGAVNASSSTFVGWNWKANGAGSSNTAGTITSTVSANATAGFSIVTWTGNGTAGATIGHGLGVKPSFFVVKCRDLTGCNWDVYHSAYGATKYTILNGTNSAGTYSGFFNNTEPTSTLITLGSDREVNQLNATYVAYCFSEVAGYSKFGNYTGNGSSDGPFVFCGFRPRWIMIKRTDSSSGADWGIHDSSRSSTNPTVEHLNANVSDAEGIFPSTYNDFLSNGFKIRGTDAYHNFSGGTYIFAAFAELPAKYSNAR